ncbi:MAG: DUF4381 domain-containing protein [Woeseiaceae bacterium]|nr:DUF4381 domain-containing protein [Woeseiaceae bacterium]
MDPSQIPLRDLHLPEAIGWWPPAPGWWFLILVAVAVLVYYAVQAIRRWRHNALRRVALGELRRIRKQFAAGIDDITLAKQLSELLRRTMLAYVPRQEVAGLTGERWLHWLDEGLDEKLFTAGAGKAVESLPYRRPDKLEDDVDLEGLIGAIETRLRTPVAAEPD